MADRRVSIIHANMSEEMQQEAIECATRALEMYDDGMEIAAYITAKFNDSFDPAWNCIVGRHYGAYVYHSEHLYFNLGQVHISLFKSG